MKFPPALIVLISLASATLSAGDTIVNAQQPDLPLPEGKPMFGFAHGNAQHSVVSTRFHPNETDALVKAH